LSLTVAEASREAVLMWVVVAHEVGKAVDSAGTVVLLIAFSPLLVWLVADMLKWKIETMNKRQETAVLGSLSHVEIRLRTYLERLELRNDSEEAVNASIEQFVRHAYTFFPKNIYILLWEGSYYSYYRRNSSLALLKLTQISQSCLSFETQILLLSALAHYEALSASPERLYLQHLQLLEKAKRADERCCFDLLAFCDNILAEKTETASFIKITRRLAQSVDKTVRKYTKVMKNSGEEEETMKMYGSFVSDVAGEEEGRKIAQRGGANRNRWDVLKDGKMAKSGLIVIECGEEETGLIVQATPLTYSHLHCFPHDLLRQSISDFLPTPFRLLLRSSLPHLNSSSLSEQELPTLFKLLQDCENYLVPVNTTVRLTTWGNKPYVLLFTAITEGVEMVLVDCESVIQAHTRLTGIMAISGVRYNGQKVDMVFPGLSLRKGNFLYTTNLGISLSVTISYLRVSTLPFKLITFNIVQEHFTRQSTSIGELDRKEGNRLPSDLKVSQRTMESKEDWINTTHQAAETGYLRLKLSLGASNSREAVEFSRKQQRTKRYLFLSFAIVVCGHIACCVFVTQMLDSLHFISSIHDYGTRNADIISVAYDARSLMLTDLSYQYDSADLRIRLVNTSVAINEVTATMKSTIGHNSGNLDAYLTQAKVPVWNLLNAKPVLTFKSFLDVLYDYAQAATALSASEPPYSTLPPAFFLARNGAGELLQIANRTLYMEVKDNEKDRVAALAILPMLIMICLVIMMLPLLVLVVPQFYRFEGASRAIWSRLYCADREKVLKCRATAATRLQSYFHFGDFEAISRPVERISPAVSTSHASSLLAVLH
jgi:hypothetical protein